jgi:anti-sigma factor RsiW
MKQSKVSGDWTSAHWTDEQLIADSYGVGPADGHLAVCAECRARGAALLSARNTRERLVPVADEVSTDFLAAQRRSIYARLAQPARTGFRRLASAAAALLVIGAGVLTYQEQHHPTATPPAAQPHISDAQLVNEVAAMGQDTEPAPVAPIEELFD